LRRPNSSCGVVGQGRESQKGGDGGDGGRVQRDDVPLVVKQFLRAAAHELVFRQAPRSRAYSTVTEHCGRGVGKDEVVVGSEWYSKRSSAAPYRPYPSTRYRAGYGVERRNRRNLTGAESERSI
jgi:hypothetical protein